MILTGLPGVIVSRARRSVWRGKVGSWALRGGEAWGGRHCSGGPLQSLGAAVGHLGPWQPVMSVADPRPVQEGTQARLRCGLVPSSGHWIPELIRVVPVRLSRCPGQGSERLWPLLRARVTIVALPSGFSFWGRSPPFLRVQGHGGEVAPLGPAGLAGVSRGTDAGWWHLCRPSVLGAAGLKGERLRSSPGHGTVLLPGQTKAASRSPDLQLRPSRASVWRGTAF